MKVDKERIILLTDSAHVDDFVEVSAFVLLRNVADFAGLKNEKVEIVLERLNDFFGMINAHFYLFREGIQRFFHETVEESEFIEDVFVGLFEHFLLEAVRQFLDEVFLFLQTELFLYVNRLFDIIVDAPTQLLRQIVLYDKLFEDFEVFAFFDVLRADVWDETADAVDVVGEGEAAEGFDEDEADGLLISRGDDVPEPHCQHYISSPIIRPNVPLDPRGIVNFFGDHPINVSVKVRHRHEQYRQNMREAKVENERLRQRPILFVVIIVYYVNLQLLHTLQNFRNLGNNYESKEAKNWKLSCNWTYQS